jgi:hypothetical protein
LGHECVVVARRERSTKARSTKTKEQIRIGKLYPSPAAFEDAIARRMLERKAETEALLDGKSQAETKRVFFEWFERAMA